MDAPVLGITGGVGCGKSTVGRILETRGFAVLDADAVAHEVLEDPEVRKILQEQLGRLPETADGRVDRRALAGRVFEDERARKKLEGVIHPRVLARIRAWRESARQRGPAAVLIPLLFESGLTEGWTSIWCVSAPLEQVVQRLAGRGWTLEQVKARQAAQWPLAEKERCSNLVIRNDGTSEQLSERVQEVLKNLMKGRA